MGDREILIGKRSWFRQAWNFTILGIEHILTRYDHEKMMMKFHVKNSNQQIRVFPFNLSSSM